MDPSWEFQAPQFVDFTHLDEEVLFYDLDIGELLGHLPYQLVIHLLLASHNSSS